MMRLKLAILFLVLFTGPVLACPMCKDSTVNIQKTIATESNGLDFNKSIYFMLGGFAAVVGVTGRVMYLATRSSD